MAAVDLVVAAFGKNEPVIPAGQFWADNVTPAVNPLTREMAMAELPPAPAAADKLFALKLNPGAATTVNGTGVVAVIEPLVPVIGRE